MVALIVALNTRIDSIWKRPTASWPGRDLGKKKSDADVVVALTCGARSSARGRRAAACWAGVGDANGPRLGWLRAGSAGWPSSIIFFPFFSFFYFLFSQIQITFEIIVQIGSNQFE